MPLHASMPTFMWSFDKPEPISNSSSGELFNSFVLSQYVQAPASLKFEASGSSQFVWAWSEPTPSASPVRINLLV